MNRVVAGVLLLAGGALGIAAYQAQTNALNSPHAVAQVAVGWAYVLAGLVAWARRPANRMGPLLLLTGFALLARQLRYSDGALLFTAFFVLGDLGYALVAYSALAYPSGRVTDRAERALVVAGFTAALVFPLSVALVYGGGGLTGFGGLSRDSLVNVASSPHAVELLEKSETVVFFGVLAAAFVLLIARRFWKATPRMRRILAPLVLAAVAFGLRAIFECVFTFVDRPFAADYLFWWQFAALFALPLTLVGGLLRAHWVRADVGDLVVELEHAQPQELRDALARALRDPTLELAFWLPERELYVDATGRRVELTADGTRAVTYLDHPGGEPLAAIVHDPSLREEPKLVRAAGAAARLALENAQLQAETRAQLRQVKESRVRIVAAADEERRRIERDLHDGAQQRLAALALQLRTAQRRLGSGESDPAVEALLESAVVELQAANEELRELVRGVYPAILTEEGLAAALESLALRNPFPIQLDVLEGRLPARVEATAYFVTCEGLANVTKHAHASKACVSIARRNGLLEVEIADDGVGGARPLENSGLSGLADRVEALGGRLSVVSPAGAGTRIRAEIPCES